MRKQVFLFFLSFLAGQLVLAQSPEVLTIRKYGHQNAGPIISEFSAFLSLPNVAADPAGQQKNAAFIMAMMNKRGIQKVSLLNASTAGVPPVVYGEVTVPGAKQTLIFYAHYDGQPVDPKQWTASPPFQPTWRTAAMEKGGQVVTLPTSGEINSEWRIYARGASDDKAGVIGILTAFDALRALHTSPSVNIKFLFEGEEEAGSPHLGEIIDLHKDLLQSDAWIICDGPVHQSGRKQVVFGVRGDQNVDVTVYGAKRPLHSGHYGNWVPNPAMTLVHLLASMKDDSGRVTIAGWHDGVEPLGDAERRAITEAPAYDDELRSELGLARTEGNGKSLMEVINQPSLNINGISSGDVGALVNVSGAAVLKSSKNQQAAQQFLAYLVSERAQDLMAKGRIAFEYPLHAGVSPDPLLKPFDQLSPPSLTLEQLGDDSKAKVKQIFKIDLAGAVDVTNLDGTAAAGGCACAGKANARRVYALAAYV